MQELAVGQRIICKYKNGRYYQSEVVELSPTTFYEVVFDDGSYSDNLFPEDIEVAEMIKISLSTFSVENMLRNVVSAHRKELIVTHIQEQVWSYLVSQFI